MKKKDKKPSRFKSVKRTAKVATASVALGAIIGATIGLLNAPKKGSELRDELTKDGEKLWRQLKITKKQIDPMVKSVFGEVSPETLKIWAKAKADILARVVKEGANLTQEKYNRIVDSAVKRATKSVKWEKKKKKLSAQFKGMFKDIKRKM